MNTLDDLRQEVAMKLNHEKHVEVQDDLASRLEDESPGTLNEIYEKWNWMKKLHAQENQ